MQILSNSLCEALNRQIDHELYSELQEAMDRLQLIKDNSSNLLFVDYYLGDKS